MKNKNKSKKEIEEKIVNDLKNLHKKIKKDIEEIDNISNQLKNLKI